MYIRATARLRPSTEVTSLVSWLHYFHSIGPWLQTVTCSNFGLGMLVAFHSYYLGVCFVCLSLLLRCGYNYVTMFMLPCACWLQ